MRSPAEEVTRSYSPERPQLTPEPRRPRTSSVVCESAPLPSDQWLLRVPDVGALLAAIAPVLARRLARSDCAGLSADLCLNLYREGFRLRFVQGRLEAVAPLGFVDASLGADGGDLCIPPEAFVRLLFGYRELDALRDAWPDIVVKRASRRVWETLFPRTQSWVWMPY